MLQEDTVAQWLEIRTNCPLLGNSSTRFRNKEFKKVTTKGFLETVLSIWSDYRHLLRTAVGLRVVRGDKREPSAQGYYWATVFLGDINKYGDQALQVGGISNETVKWSELCGTWTPE
jgi:hypothetical protein